MKIVSIIIPAYNEGAFIAQLLEHIIKVPTETIGFKKEIIVVDDGSTDDTANIAAGFAGVTVIQQQNSGKGRAVQRGVKDCTGDYVLVQDADLEYSPADYLVMLPALTPDNNTAVYGSRPRGVIERHGWKNPFPGRDPDQQLGPWIMNVVLAIQTFILYGRWITDMLTGYKIYPAATIKSFNIKTHGFETDHELSAKLVKAGVDIVEIPISYTPRSLEEGKKIRAIDGLIAIWTLIKYRFVD
ncbi:MAG: glycosyltransferase family 2 protein [Magnetococcales bacterium]|nr:glycosyltransferase family 2 protein [Magnetococcales bacterium]